ncbi:hypothetical protein H7X46_14485 [Pseudonocardia sp. C8]|uniref:TY-Chap domain-containing protein n=1 Tax=Pseudonocardia sp. C8 TaxID=2762759 RepID=UPI0016433AC5|nr:hypothetical protein [Pseudonocardia sp. C8]MBC3192270.1 hypothetical protein [Pseudonocardia sp. C8]
MDDVRRVVARALHDTRDGGTAVLGADSGARGVVQWICFGSDGYLIDVPDPARCRGGLLRRMWRRSEPDPDGLSDEQVRGLQRLGFGPGDHGYERHTRADELGHDQLVHLIVSALDVVGLDGEPVSAEVF